MCNELQVSLQGHPRNTVDKEELVNKWNELSNYQIGKKKNHSGDQSIINGFYSNQFINKQTYQTTDPFMHQKIC